MLLSARRQKADVDLLLQLRAGDADAFDLLYRRHEGAAVALAYRLVGDFAMAEEVVQDAFLAVWRESASYEAGRGSVRSWIYGIVHHGAIDAQRRKARVDSRQASAQLLPDSRSGHAFPELEAVRRESARITWAELESLPAAQRQVIKLAFQSELTCGEIAQLLGVPLGTVKGRMRLGLEKLRRSLAPAGHAEELAS